MNNNNDTLDKYTVLETLGYGINSIMKLGLDQES